MVLKIRASCETNKRAIVVLLRVEVQKFGQIRVGTFNQGTQWVPRNTVTEQIGHTTIRKLGITSGPSLFFFWRKKILMDSHPYSHETSIFTLGAPHEEVQGRQTKLHPGFTMGKLVQPSPGISILRDAHIVLSNRS